MAMADSRFQSIHLEGQSRRDLFRQARAKLEDCCGMMTMAGDLRQLSVDAPGADATKALPAPNPNAVYCLKDGDKTYRLAVGVNSVGRLPDNAVVLADDHVSRRHCAVIVHSDGRCELHDIASKNGTLLNGKRLAGPTPMRTGDQITLCGKLLELIEEQAKSKSNVA
jgi:hypothetical protein